MGIKRSKEFGNIVKREREALGMTQQELAAALGYSADDAGHCIYMIEKGERGLSSEKVERLKKIFKCDDDYLLGQSKHKNSLEKSVDELFAINYREIWEEEYLLSFITNILGWILIGKVGFIEENYSGIRGRNFVVRDESDLGALSDHENFTCQYLIFDEQSKTRVVNYMEFKKLARAVVQRTAIDVKILAHYPVPAADFDAHLYNKGCGGEKEAEFDALHRFFEKAETSDPE